MKCGIDAQLAAGTATGIGEYVRGLIPALREIGVDLDALAFPALDPWRFDRRVLWDQVLLPLAAMRAQVRVLHCASGTMPRFASAPLVVTVHDIAWLRTQAHTRPYARAYFGAYALACYRRAAHILVDSAFSKRELIDVSDIAEDRITVAYPGVASDFTMLTRRPGAAFTVLAVGTVEPRKNLVTAIRALAPLADARLISVGPPTPYSEECRALAASLGMADRLELRGYVDRAGLLDLYATCTLAVMPSRYEGFGYGAAQALCAGLPLVSSNAASLPELVQDHGLALDPDDVAAWGAALRGIRDDRERYERAASAYRAQAALRFGWSTCAHIVAAVYARVGQV